MINLSNNNKRRRWGNVYIKLGSYILYSWSISFKYFVPKRQVSIRLRLQLFILLASDSPIEVCEQVSIFLDLDRVVKGYHHCHVLIAVCVPISEIYSDFLDRHYYWEWKWG